MKAKRSSIQQVPLSLGQIHNNILDKIAVLDNLNQQYKHKQQEHFLRTFANVLEKMGNDLIFAQQAYRNIDIQIKRDAHCIELAQELNFFKNECFQLKKTNSQLQRNIKEMKQKIDIQESQIQALKLSQHKKYKSIQHLKKQNLKLKNQIQNLKKHEEQRMQEQQKKILEKIQLLNISKDKFVQNYENYLNIYQIPLRKTAFTERNNKRRINRINLNGLNEKANTNLQIKNQKFRLKSTFHTSFKNNSMQKETNNHKSTRK